MKASSNNKQQAPGFKMIVIFSLPFFLLAACSNNNGEVKDRAVRADIVSCGTVQFSDGCNPAVDSFIAYGLALVHHMTYEPAENIFDQVLETSPNCFWGHWGKALTYIHPLWPEEPTEEKMKLGFELTQQALKLAKTPREEAFGTALASYYDNGLTKTHKERLKIYADAWGNAYKQLPGDQEAKAWYALHLIATADPADKSYKNQHKAGALAEEVLQVIPDHPGGFHYMIHAYDSPELARKALEAAARYDKIAPDVPHALHMPTHIFTRLGLWKESIDWNLRSAKVSLDRPVNGKISMHYFHALDYLVYAYLQRQEDDKATEVLAKIKGLKGGFQPSSAAAYALAAAEPRFALERRQWGKAAGIIPRTPAHFDWDKFPEYESLSHYAVGLGAARMGAANKAKTALGQMERLQQKATNPYWKEQIEIQKNTIKAWLAFAGKNNKDALALMKLAANQEAATSKHPVTPGELLPASELYGDLLLELNNPAAAIAQYEVALQRSPGRLNSIAGAAKAAAIATAIPTCIGTVREQLVWN